MRLCNFILFLPFILLSCGGMSEDELYQKAAAAYEERNIDESTRLFEELVDRFPEGKYTEEALFLLASNYGDNMGDYRKGIATYRRLREMFPSGEKAAASLFLIGFVYNNHLHNLDSARIAYEEFLTLYPTHEMAASARFELDNLGKSPDELFRPAVTEKTGDRKASGGKKKSPRSAGK